MSHESRLLDLIIQWEELRAAGQEPSPAELCESCPELLPELEQRLRALAGMAGMLDQTVVASTANTHNVAYPPGQATDLPAVAWPAIPQYEILEELGRGGMGVVFKARHMALKRIVALKTILACGAIREEQRKRFLREARVMALLQHPHIVQIHEIGQLGEHPFLVMEYVPGEDLGARIQGKPWAAREAAALVAKLARAVHAAHQLGIVHRDLKPNNILLTADGTPKICDFGLAKHFADHTDRTRTGQIMGTPAYMAPEQFGGDSHSLGPAVDVHALGVVLYETLTGHPPYLADNPIDTLKLVTSQEPIPPRRAQPTIPRDLETVCLKCLAKEPHRRYATAAALADDLDRFLAHERVHARPVGIVGLGQRWCRAHPGRASLIFAAIVATVLLMSLTLVYNRRLALQLDHTNAEHREVLATQQKLRDTLLRQVAEQLDGDLRQLASVPLTTAALLEHRPDWDEPQLQQAVVDVLTKAPGIFGMCVAFEPYQWRSDREDFALYVCRRSDELVVSQLLPPDYQPLYREWQWYRACQDSPQGRWSEPYIDRGGGQVPMVTFSAPIHRNGTFVGVVTADLAMEYFAQLRGSIERLDWGARSYCFLVGSGQRLLAHPSDRYEFPGPDSDFARLPLDASLRSLAAQWDELPTGTGRAVDFTTGLPATFAYARIPAAGWTLVNVTY